MGRWRDRRGVASGFYRLDQAGGFRRWSDTQLLVKDAHAFFVLAHSGRRLASARVELHQVTMGRLVQGIQRQPAPGIGQGRGMIALLAGAVRQPFQR